MEPRQSHPTAIAVLRQELNRNRVRTCLGVRAWLAREIWAWRTLVAKTKQVGRSAITGQFVPIKYTQQHPRTTEIERVRVGTRKK